MTDKGWADIYSAALHRGLDHGYAAFLADLYVARKNNAIPPIPIVDNDLQRLVADMEAETDA